MRRVRVGCSRRDLRLRAKEGMGGERPENPWTLRAVQCIYALM